MSEVGWYIPIGDQWCWCTASIAGTTFGWNTGTIFWFAPIAASRSCGILSWTSGSLGADAGLK